MDILEKFCRYVRLSKNAGTHAKGVKLQINTYTYTCESLISGQNNPCTCNILSRDDRDDKIVVCFKGSVLFGDWFRDAWAWKLKWPYGKTTPDMDKVWIHAGFKNEYSSIRIKLLRELSDLIAQRKKPQHITFCGHSLGGALASVAALDSHESIDPKMVVSSLYSFGSPRTYNTAGSKIFASKMEYTNRAVFANDPVVQMPWIDYKHVGRPVHIKQDLSVEFVDFNESVFLCKPMDHLVENYDNMFRFLMNDPGMVELFNKNLFDDPADNALLPGSLIF